MSIIETSSAGNPDVVSDAEIITAELIAKIVAGIAQIGVALHTIQQAGHAAVLTGNRIVVAGVIEAQMVQCNGHGFWNVFALDGTPPMWTVGTHHPNATNWAGCGD